MAMDTEIRRAFMKALDEDDEFRQEVRQRLLSRELLELPEKFAAFSAYVHDFIAEQRETNAELKSDVAGLKVSQERMEGQLKRIADDVGFLKGNVAFYAARDRFEFILEQLQLYYVKLLSRQDLVAMVRRYGAERIDFPHRRSFYNADLVVEAKAADNSPCYVAVEASYTADRRDSDRVIRNTQFLNLFTGCQAFGVIASVDNDRDIQPLVDSRELHWFQLQPEDLQPT